MPITEVLSHHKKPRSRAEDLREIQNMAEWMDAGFTIPGTKINFGLDPLIGIIPGIGDTVTVAVAAYIIGKSSKYNLPGHLKAKMIRNVFVDWLVGLVPFFGDIFDIGYKANRKNVDILLDHLNSMSSQT